MAKQTNTTVISARRARLLFTGILASFVILSAGALANASAAPLHVDYTVRVASVDERLFHVTAEIKDINQPRLDLSLPVWTPGWYTVENYAKNILRLKIRDASGNSIQYIRVRKQTWRVPTKGITSLTVEFDYRA